MALSINHVWKDTNVVINTLMMIASTRPKTKKNLSLEEVSSTTE
eukprot:CAMPEP_0169399090 /NCGR_PEP_ID=MMETSP1017-20121227/53001_1 /TAXON_ID=342587 /ORGANISM="Karlodinium micrum, Strain CCMP2283" /LENGTH=43 /DNA_ID= /DNA_START= /DNA_END= /DNA_ORIENTATION=